ncbi:MAG: 4Fe-4S dicluster domain-containing protein [Lamprobacter sp.]|uniref:4Fe-4S dicluster domain-containing protein n=1 Tax=Lamprobacter sp. TaxID=3100796 RepID=UPI002B2572CC|nr:4Fe-4S dicluster domain-containing protein [Lamprobacter sp.]MEA3641793.1 4Fe-4S dicluster domain-containing protein [Lamprobacter sp.]
MPISLDCWRVAQHLTPTDGLRVPCLGGLTPAWLLELVATAADRPVHLLDRGLCAACPSGRADPEDPDNDTQASHPAAWCLGETARLLDGIGLRRERWPRLTTAPTADDVSASGSQEAKPAERPALQRPEPLLETRLSRRAFFTGRCAESPRSRGQESPGRRDPMSRQDRRGSMPLLPVALMESRQGCQIPQPQPQPQQERMPSQGLLLASEEQGADRSHERPPEQRHQDQRPPDQGPTDQRLPERLPEQARRLAALLRLAPAECVPARLFPALAITDACDHHSLCASACPSGALSRDHRDGEQGHRFNPSDCSACGLCVALCPEQAIELRPIAIQDGEGGMSATLTQTLTRFSTRACAGCGAAIPVADANRPIHERPGHDRLDADGLDQGRPNGDNMSAGSTSTESTSADKMDESLLCQACARDRDFARSAFQTLFADRMFSHLP